MLQGGTIKERGNRKLKNNNIIFLKFANMLQLFKCHSEAGPDRSSWVLPYMLNITMKGWLTGWINAQYTVLSGWSVVHVSVAAVGRGFLQQ